MERELTNKLLESGNLTEYFRATNEIYKKEMATYLNLVAEGKDIVTDGTHVTLNFGDEPLTIEEALGITPPQSKDNSPEF